MARREALHDQAKPLAKRLEAQAERKEATPPAAPSTATTAIASGAPPPPQQAPMRAKREGFAADSVARESRAIGAVADADPARELERIARLREAGRHDEADRALEALRRRHPDFRIPEAMWQRVKPR